MLVSEPAGRGRDRQRAVPDLPHRAVPPPSQNSAIYAK